MKGIAIPLCIFVATSRLAECAGASFIGSATIDVCSRAQGKTGQSLQEPGCEGQRGNWAALWVQLHLAATGRGETASFVFAPGNVDGRNEIAIAKLAKGLFG